MSERLPKLEQVINNVADGGVLLVFDRYLTAQNLIELQELVALQFAGQLRRDPDAPQTAPAQPGEG